MFMEWFPQYDFITLWGGKPFVNEIFKVEKLLIPITEARNEYLSLKNIVITFSLFGFIFGVLLVYNFRSFKDENE